MRSTTPTVRSTTPTAASTTATATSTNAVATVATVSTTSPITPKRSSKKPALASGTVPITRKTVRIATVSFRLSIVFFIAKIALAFYNKTSTQNACMFIHCVPCQERVRISRALWSAELLFRTGSARRADRNVCPTFLPAPQEWGERGTDGFRETRRAQETRISFLWNCRMIAHSSCSIRTWSRPVITKVAAQWAETRRNSIAWMDSLTCRQAWRQARSGMKSH